MHDRPASHQGDRDTRRLPRVVREVDARASYCPGPLMEAIRLVRESSVGETVAVVAAAGGTATGIPAWVARTGHVLTSVEDLADGRRYLITRAR